MNLIDKLKATKEGSPELDLEIMKAIGEVPESAAPPRLHSTFSDEHVEEMLGIKFSHKEEVTVGGIDSARHGCVIPVVKEVTKYTRSIDAAMTLIPEGWVIMSMNWHHIGPWVASIKNNKSNVCGHHKSLPIAICIAALKAREKAPVDSELDSHNEDFHPGCDNGSDVQELCANVDRNIKAMRELG